MAFEKSEVVVRSVDPDKNCGFEIRRGGDSVRCIGSGLPDGQLDIALSAAQKKAVMDALKAALKAALSGFSEK